MKEDLTDLPESLRSSYPELEKIRLRSKTYSSICTTFILIGALGFIIVFIVFFVTTNFMYLVYGFGITVAYCIIIHLLTLPRLAYKNYFNSIKAKHLSVILKDIDPSFEYIGGTIPVDNVRETNLFKNGSITSETLQGEDYFTGKYHGVNVQISEINFGVSKKGEEYGKTGNFIVSVLFIAEFNKHLTSESFIQDIWYNGNINQQYHDNVTSIPKGKNVILENPDFEKAFFTTSTDEIECRYILSFPFMEALLELRNNQINSRMYLSFYKNKMAILLRGKNLFEANLSKSIVEDKTFERFSKETLGLLKIVDVLHLNDRIG